MESYSTVYEPVLLNALSSVDSMITDKNDLSKDPSHDFGEDDSHPIYTSTRCMQTIIKCKNLQEYSQIQVQYQANQLDFSGHLMSAIENGYSGTLGCHFIYPCGVSIKEVYGKLGAVTNKVLESESDRFYFSQEMPAKPTPKDLLEDVILSVKKASQVKPNRSNPEFLENELKYVDCILDAAAHFRGQMHNKVAKMIQDKLFERDSVVAFQDDSSIRYFFNKKTKGQYASQDKLNEALLGVKSQGKDGIPRLHVVYHAQAHTTGFDIKYRSQAEGLI